MQKGLLLREFINARSVAISLFIFSLIVFANGFSVLTSNQIDAVNKFATATENYGVTPGNAIKSWAELQITASAIETASMKDETAMWNHIEKSFSTNEKILRLTERALRSFEILDIYSDLLKQLSSDNYTKALDSSSKEIGEDLDSAIEFYNSRFETSISTFGCISAAIIRGSGGLYIRGKQGMAIKKVVADADQTIGYLTLEIEKVADALELGIDKELDTLENELKVATKYAPRIKDGDLEYPIIPDLASYVSVFELLRRGRNAKKIVSQSKIAAKKYREAHGQLFEATRHKISDVENLIAIIDSLKIEIDAAIKLNNAIELEEK